MPRNPESRTHPAKIETLYVGTERQVLGRSRNPGSPVSFAVRVPVRLDAPEDRVRGVVEAALLAGLPDLRRREFDRVRILELHELESLLGH